MFDQRLFERTSSRSWGKGICGANNRCKDCKLHFLLGKVWSKLKNSRKHWNARQRGFVLFSSWSPGERRSAHTPWWRKQNTLHTWEKQSLQHDRYLVWSMYNPDSRLVCFLILSDLDDISLSVPTLITISPPHLLKLGVDPAVYTAVTCICNHRTACLSTTRALSWIL